MSVTYVKGSSPLGSIGSIASLAGMVTGQPWLTALGMGANTATSLFNGGGYSTPGFMNQNNNPLLGLGGIFSGNIATPDNITQRGK